MSLPWIAVQLEHGQRLAGAGEAGGLQVVGGLDVRGRQAAAGAAADLQRQGVRGGRAGGRLAPRRSGAEMRADGTRAQGPTPAAGSAGGRRRCCPGRPRPSAGARGRRARPARRPGRGTAAPGRPGSGAGGRRTRPPRRRTGAATWSSRRLGVVPVTVRPWARAKAATAAYWAGVGLKRAVNWAGVRKWWYSGSCGSYRRRSRSSSPCGSRGASARVSGMVSDGATRPTSRAEAAAAVRWPGSGDPAARTRLPDRRAQQRDGQSQQQQHAAASRSRQAGIVRAEVSRKLVLSKRRIHRTKQVPATRHG